MEYSATTRLPLQTLTVSFTICHYSAKFTHIYFTMWEKVLSPKGGENTRGLSSSSFLAIHAKGGENIKPKAKGPHTAPPFQKILK
jgi:hypothetical protein